MSESGTFFWPEIKGNGLIGSNEDMTHLTQERLENSFGQFIINPYNRTNTDKISDSLKNIEENHKTYANPSNEWDEEKERKFESMAKKAYSSILDADLDGLVKKYFEMNKVTWLDNLFIKEFDDITVNDFKDPTKVKEFIGETQEFGQTDLSNKQQDLIDNRRIMSNKEFFDNQFLSDISVKYKKSPENFIEVKFTVDHSNGEVGKKIINEAWPSAKIALESDLGSTHLTSPRLGYKYEKEKQSVTSAAKDKGGYKESSTNVWYKEGKEPKNIDVINPKKLEDLELDVKNPTKYWETEEFTDKFTSKIKNPKAGEPKDTKEQKLQIENIAGRWRDTLRRKGKEPTEKDIKEFEEQLGEYRTQQQSAGVAAATQLDRENSIKINADEMKLITDGIGWFETKVRTPNNFIELFDKLIKRGAIHELIKSKINLSPKYFRDFTFTFKIKSPELLEEHGLYNDYLWAPLNVKIEANKKVSMGHLYKVSKKPTVRQGKESKQWAHKPKSISTTTPDKYKTAEGIELDAKSGFNEARNHLAVLIKSGIRRLERAAPYLGE